MTGVLSEAPPRTRMPEPVAGGRRDAAIASAALVSTATGLLVVALAYAGARTNSPWADPLFWAGLLVIFLPCALRLAGERAGRVERLWLVVALGLALYGVKVLLEPNGFTLHDELGQYRSVTTILRTGRLYVANPLVPAYSYYPGLVSLTAALARLSGLGVFTCGVIIVGVARALLVGGLFLLVERVTRSARVAGLAVLLYAANPNFVFFDGQFAYESLALGLGALTLWAAANVLEEGPVDRRDLAAAAVLDGGLVLTHHLTSYAVALAILAWALIEPLRRGPLRRYAWRSAGPGLLLAGFVVAITAGYAFFSWPETESDIGSSVLVSLHGVWAVVSGAVAGKHPFAGAAGYPNPPLEQVVGILSVALLIGALPLGLYAAWRHRPRSGGLAVLWVAALLYPPSLALRLTAGGSETSSRTSEFVFIGLGAVLAIAFAYRLRRTPASPRPTSRRWLILAGIYLGLVFVGGITVGNPLYQLLPGSYQVAAANRSVDAEATAAAHWAQRLPAGSKFLSDETDEELFTAYTRLRPQTGYFRGTGIGVLFTSPRLGPAERAIIRFEKLRFLVVDRRDSTMLPAAGHYFDGADPAIGYLAPIPAAALAKFSRSRCLSRIFDSGNVTIYDTGPLLRGCR